MKMKSVKAFLSIVTAASLAVSAPAAVFAEDAAAQEAEAQDSDGEATAEDFTIAFDGGELSVTNQTTQTIKEAKLVEAAADDSEEADNSEETADASKEAKMDLVLTEEDGTEHTFQDVTVDKWKDAVLVNSYEFLYINYKDESGKDQEAAETADERTFDEPITMYVSANVHVRKKADKESESLKVAALGDEFKVIAAVPGWFKVENGDDTGYVFHSYLTEDKAAVDALVKAKQEADAAAAQAAAAAAAQAAQQQAAAAAAQPAQKTEVSRQAYDDCDGSGHGYYEITWSDGSVTYENY
ncbi:SH3 domain-containing protein [Blautia ammoniilytica]|uniref:SH3 domain-containing protein n=1 Tax=Blautia ammoniilytica TaxID=2981782 RepID=A0ABT2TPP8_9FIRM|nr:SH3 domain-containing protein [Blautia ammoniilytica]MCU6764210.1 SH3 domain-containing protein [Blautia ammoniilytica]SCH21796.1 SH3 domain protein [uncultured Blautia sp.]